MIKFYEENKEITLGELIQDYRRNRRKRYIVRVNIGDFDNYETIIIDDIKIDLTDCDKCYDGYSICIEKNYRQIGYQNEIKEEQERSYCFYYNIHSIEEFLDEEITIIGEWADEE